MRHFCNWLSSCAGILMMMQRRELIWVVVSEGFGQVDQICSKLNSSWLIKGVSCSEKTWNSTASNESHSNTTPNKAYPFAIFPAHQIFQYEVHLPYRLHGHLRRYGKHGSKPNGYRSHPRGRSGYSSRSCES
jgi:hypothetical protein